MFKTLNTMCWSHSNKVTVPHEDCHNRHCGTNSSVVVEDIEYVVVTFRECKEHTRREMTNFPTRAKKNAEIYEPVDWLAMQCSVSLLRQGQNKLSCAASRECREIRAGRLVWCTVQNELFQSSLQVCLKCSKIPASRLAWHAHQLSQQIWDMSCAEHRGGWLITVFTDALSCLCSKVKSEAAIYIAIQGWHVTVFTDALFVYQSKSWSWDTNRNSRAPHQIKARTKPELCLKHHHIE